MTHSRSRIVTIAILASLVTSCSLPFGLGGGTSSSSASSSSEPIAIPETPNVTYQGTVEALSISLSMDATQQLRLEDGTTILLQSIIDLASYLGRSVEVTGSVRPIGGGEMLMRVDRITALDPLPFSSSSEPSSSSSSELSSMVSSVAYSSKIPPSSTPIVSSRAPSSRSSVPPPASPTPAPAPVLYEGSDELTARAGAMAKVTGDSARWTQTYCSKITKTCFVFHSYWYYNALNAKQRSLWHMEVGPNEINALGDGPITIDLLSGETMFDGVVQSSGETVVGYKNTPDGNHLEIKGPVNLQGAVDRIVKGITPQP